MSVPRSGEGDALKFPLFPQFSRAGVTSTQPLVNTLFSPYGSFLSTSPFGDVQKLQFKVNVLKLDMLKSSGPSDYAEAIARLEEELKGLKDAELGSHTPIAKIVRAGDLRQLEASIEDLKAKLRELLEKEEKADPKVPMDEWVVVESRSAEDRVKNVWDELLEDGELL